MIWINCQRKFVHNDVSVIRDASWNNLANLDAAIVLPLASIQRNFSCFPFINTVSTKVDLLVD